MRFLCLIPAYNAENSIDELLERLLLFVPKDDILVVNDGSTDKTGQKTKDKGIKIISNKVNLGKGAALKVGFNYAIENRYDAIITLDADLQHPPELIPKFLSAAENSDLVIGKRNIKLSNTPIDRYISNKLTSLIISTLLRKKIPDSQCGYRLIKTEALKKVSLQSNKYELESEMIIKFCKKGYRISTVDIPTIYKGEKSSIRRVKDTLAFIRLVLRELFR